MRDLSVYSLEYLQSYYSDFHKDFYGSRPRFLTEEQWNSREFLETAINGIHNQMDNMRLSYAGREELRSNGWIVDEDDYITDPMADAERFAELDAEFYGKM